VSECLFIRETRLILKQQTGERGMYERGSVSVGGDKVRCVCVSKEEEGGWEGDEDRGPEQ